MFIIVAVLALVFGPGALRTGLNYDADLALQVSQITAVVFAAVGIILILPFILSLTDR